MKLHTVCLVMTIALAACAGKDSISVPAAPETPSPPPAITVSELVYHDAANFTVEGKGWTDTEGAYDRLPARAREIVREPVWNLAKHTAGVCVRFVTDSPRIGAYWDGGGAMNHMAATGNSGLDLYVKQDGEWVFAGVGRPQEGWTRAVIAKDLPAKSREYLLYLPLYNDVTTLMIGVEDSASITPAPPRPPETAKPIVFYGTSITQGGCASRAGMCHPAILGRWFDREVINLGFSGNGRMDMELADLLGEIDAALYVLETLPNMTPEGIDERFVPFVERLRMLKPETPILLVESPIEPETNPDNEAFARAWTTLTDRQTPSLYYLEGAPQWAGRENGTVDGVHPTDLGFYRMALVYYPALEQILAGP